MNFLCEKSLLIEAVGNVQRAVAAKSDIAVLEGIYLRAYGSTLSLVGFDMELGITTTMDATVKEPGEIVMPARMFGDIVRKMPGDKIAFSSDDKLNTVIRSDVTEFSIKGMPSADYPEIPKVDDGIGFTIAQDVLKSMVRQTIFAVAVPDAPMPIYTGSLFEVSPDRLRIVSVDGFRLAIRSEIIQNKESAKFIVPGKTLQEILKLLKDEEKPCSMIVGRRHIIFEIDGYAVISRLLDGEFMDYEHKILGDTTALTTITVNTRTFIDTVDRVSLVINNRLISPMLCDFRDNAIRVSCSTAQGNATDTIPAQIDGAEDEMGFNYRYLLDALRNSECDELKIELAGARKPMKILPKEGESFLFLVLPLKLR